MSGALGSLKRMKADCEFHKWGVDERGVGGRLFHEDASSSPGRHREGEPCKMGSC